MSFLSSITGSYKSASGLLPKLSGQLSSWGVSTPIGSLGDIVFEVSSSKIRTFKDFHRSTKARYSSHEIIGQKPILEYIGPDGEEITFTIRFNVSWGVNPAEETKKIRELCENGETMYLVLCNQTVGENPWVIESVSESTEVIDNSGRIAATQIELTLKEYVPTIT